MRKISALPASVRGANAPSNKVALGVIGLGARARTVVPSLVGLPNVRIVAMADCDLRRVRGGWAHTYVSRTYSPCPRKTDLIYSPVCKAK